MQPQATKNQSCSSILSLWIQNGPADSSKKWQAFTQYIQKDSKQCAKKKVRQMEIRNKQ